MHSSRECTKQLSVKQWSSLLCERKSHMVAAALEIEGQDGMWRLAKDAKRIFEARMSKSLGGGFIISMKNTIVDVQGSEVSLYAVVKHKSGEDEIQRERCRVRNKKKMTVPRTRSLKHAVHVSPSSVDVVVIHRLQ